MPRAAPARCLDPANPTWWDALPVQLSDLSQEAIVHMLHKAGYRVEGSVTRLIQFGPAMTGAGTGPAHALSDTTHTAATHMSYHMACGFCTALACLVANATASDLALHGVDGAGVSYCRCVLAAQVFAWLTFGGAQVRP